MSMRTLLRGVSRFAQNGAPQSRRQTEQWQMLDDTIASASINEIRVLPQKHSPGVGGLRSAMVVVESCASSCGAHAVFADAGGTVGRSSSDASRAQRFAVHGCNVLNVPKAASAQFVTARNFSATR